LVEKYFGAHAKKNFKNFVVLDIAKIWLNDNEGRVFSALFKKRTNGEYREMVARVGVRKNCKSSLKFEPSKKNLLSVYDMLKRRYRFISLEGLKLLTLGGETWRIF